MPNGGDKVVVADGNHSPKHMTKYPNLGYKFACSERFAELSPFLKYRGEYDDKDVLLYSGSSVDSMSLHAPILQDIKHSKDFYMVDLCAILPHNWEFIHNQPSHGDDIDAKLANCLISIVSGDVVGFNGIDTAIQNVITNSSVEGYLWTSADGDATWTGRYEVSQWIQWMRSFAMFNEFFAPDSLFAKFRIPLADIVDPNDGQRVFKVLDQAWDLFNRMLENYQGLAAPVGTNSGDQERNTQIWFRDLDNNIILRKVYNWESVEGRLAFYYDFIDNSNITIADFYGSPVTDQSSGDVAEMYDGLINDNGVGYEEVFKVWTDNTGKVFDLLDYSENVYKQLNIEPIIAYQLICAEFFTNDLIDYVYSAEIYRQIWESVAYDGDLTFEYNGRFLPYDGFSAITISEVLGNTGTLYFYDLVMSLITHKRSLRYIDYFVGGRSTPLLAADTSVDVNNNVASAIDITQKAIIARFNLFVQRVGRKSKNYLKQIFHAEDRVDRTVPVKIGHISELIYKEETQNTAADQLELDNSRTATLKAHNKQFAFDTDCDVASIIIGISSYEITRFYDRGLDPFALKVDRFDMFNPMLQYLGDQPISQSELNAGLPVDSYFAYTNRNMEYKVGVDYCAGAFRNELKDWIFRQPAADRDTVIGPDFIRAHQNELDRYYIALTSEKSYGRYHFICKYNNHITASRNMVFAPILKF